MLIQLYWLQVELTDVRLQLPFAVRQPVTARRQPSAVAPSGLQWRLAGEAALKCGGGGAWGEGRVEEAAASCRKLWRVRGGEGGWLVTSHGAVLAAEQLTRERMPPIGVCAASVAMSMKIRGSVNRGTWVLYKKKIRVNLRLTEQYLTAKASFSDFFEPDNTKDKKLKCCAT